MINLIKVKYYNANNIMKNASKQPRLLQKTVFNCSRPETTTHSSYLKQVIYHNLWNKVD